MIQDLFFKSTTFFTLVFLSQLAISCGKKVENPEDKFTELKKVEKDKVNGIYFLNFDGKVNLNRIGWHNIYNSDWEKDAKFLGENNVYDSGVGLFGCMKIDLNANLVKIFLPIQKESFTYPISSEYVLDKDKPSEANLILTMKTPISDIRFTVYKDRKIEFEHGQIWRKDNYNGKVLTSEMDCKDFSLKIIESCKVVRKKGEYFVSEPEGSDIRKELTLDSEILIHLLLNAKVSTDEYQTNWNKSDVSFKKIKFEGREGYIDSIHLEKNPSHCYYPSISAKRILLANAEWGGSYFESDRIIYAREGDSGEFDFEISSPSYEDSYIIENFKWQKNSLKFAIRHVDQYEGEILSDVNYAQEISFSRFHMLTPWNRLLDYDSKYTSSLLPKK